MSIGAALTALNIDSDLISDMQHFVWKSETPEEEHKRLKEEMRQEQVNLEREEMGVIIGYTKEE